MSVYDELMNEAYSRRPPSTRKRMPRSKPPHRKQNPDVEALRRKLKKEFEEARRKKKEDVAVEDHTEYEGPSLREKPEKLRRGHSVPRSGEKKHPTVQGGWLSKSGGTGEGRKVVGSWAQERHRKPGSKVDPPITYAAKDHTEYEGPSLKEKLARLKEEEYTPTYRPPPSKVRKEISKSVKSSGWFKKKSPVSGQTKLARVRPHEDPTSLSKPHTRAVSHATSQPTKKDPKGTLTVAHTEYEGPSLREKLQYLMDQTGKTPASKLPREKKSKIMAKWLSKRGASKSKSAPGSVTGFSQQQKTTTKGGEPATATHTPKKGEKGGGGTSPFVSRTRIQIRPEEGPSKGAETKKKPYATKF